MTSTPAKTTIWSVGFVIMLIVNFFQFMGQQMMGTVIPLYADSLGATASAVGIVTGAFGFTALAVRPFAGPAFDSFSRKKLLLISMAFCTVATASYGFMDNVAGLIFMRLIHGIGMGGAGPLGLALVTDVLPPEKLSSGVSVYMLGQAVGQAIGPAVGIELSRIVGYRNTFLIAGACLVVGFILFLRVHEKDRERPPYKIRLNRMFAKEAAVPAIALGMLSVSFACTSSYIALYGEMQGVAAIGLYFTVYAVCLLATRPLFGKISDAHGATTVLIPAIICFAISYVILHFATTLPVFLISAVVAACGYGVCVPLIQAFMMGRVPQQRRGAGSNTSYVGLDLGFMVGPMIGGLVIEVLMSATGSELSAYSWMWIVMIIPIAVAFLLFFVLHRQEKRPR